jgi:hypothetical protein
MLKEGEVYCFHVEREVEMPDNSTCFILTGPGMRKFLLPSACYKEYGIKAGSYIKCRIDKINCKGKIFLEPENPEYTEGKSYIFEIAGSENKTDSRGSDRKVLIVEDKFGNRIPVTAFPDAILPESGGRINLTVIRIRKGKLLLAGINDQCEKISLKLGKIYEFIIERIETGTDDKDYFVVKDPEGHLHSLSRKYYEYYGFKPGMKFRGIIRKSGRNSRKFIEPENPFYKKGSVIELKIRNSFPNPVNNTFTVELTDKFGFDHCLEIRKKPANDTLSCRVVGIKKGKPQLKNL